MDDERAERHRMIRDSAVAIVQPENGLSRIRALRFGAVDFDLTAWQKMAELGWIDLRVSENEGGPGLGIAELCILAEEMGAALCPEPLVPAAVFAPLLPTGIRKQVMSGAVVILPAWQGRANDLDFTAGVELQGEHITGRKVFVQAARGADAFLVTTRDGPVLVKRNSSGVSLDILATQDGGSFGTVNLRGAACQLLSGTIADKMEEAILGTAAYLLGLADRAFELTLDYLRTRQQFGRFIGSFQAIQHRAADLKVQIELTRATIMRAAITLESGAPLVGRRAAVSRAKARAGDTAMLVTRQAIQLHGGIGFADESDIGLFLRKAMVVSNLFGSPAIHRARFAQAASDANAVC